MKLLQWGVQIGCRCCHCWFLSGKEETGGRTFLPRIFCFSTVEWQAGWLAGWLATLSSGDPFPEAPRRKAGVRTVPFNPVSYCRTSVFSHVGVRDPNGVTNGVQWTTVARVESVLTRAGCFRREGGLPASLDSWTALVGLTAFADPRAAASLAPDLFRGELRRIRKGWGFWDDGAFFSASIW